MLTVEEETALVRAAQAGDRRAEARLIREFEPFIDRAVRRFSPYGRNAEDLKQEATIGFIKALRRHDSDRSRLATTAALWVKAALTESLDRLRLVRLQKTASAKRALVNLPRFLDQLERERPNSTSAERLEEAARHFEIDISTAQTIAGSAFGHASLDAPRDAGDGIDTFLDQLPDPVDLEEELIARDEAEADRRLVAEAIASIKSSRCRDIAAARFGMYGGEPVMLDDCAIIYDISRGRVTQLQARAFAEIESFIRRKLGRPKATAETEPAQEAA